MRDRGLLCGVLAAGLPDHPQCFFHEDFTLGPVALHPLLYGSVPHGLALLVQGSVRSLAVNGHVLVVYSVIGARAVVSAVSGLRL